MNSISSEVLTPNESGKSLIIGVGNPILSDDGVGIHIVKILQKKFQHISNLEFDELSTGGLSLAERFIGYKNVLMIDAMALEGGIPGAVYRLTIEDFKNTVHTYCAHDCNLATAYEILKEKLGAEKMPENVVIIGIEVEVITEFSETLTKTVQKALPEAIALAEEEIREFIKQ
ncbi:MAG: hydrogenase maturation protease [Candidatus Thorarchaeota archaeon]